MEGSIEYFLKKLAENLRSGELQGIEEESLSRLLGQTREMDEERLARLRHLARRNCEIALALRRGSQAARRAIESGRASGKSVVYSAKGDSQEIGSTGSAVKINL